MSETRKLLARITALRQQLDQAQGLVNDARSAAATILDESVALESTLRAAEEHDLILDAALNQGEPAAPRRTPAQLSSRARRVLERGRDLLGQLRDLGEPLTRDGDPSPLLHLYRDTVSMMDTALRTVALLPDSVATQMHLCRGLEVTLEEVAGRLRTIIAGTEREKHQLAQVDRLAAYLFAMDAGQPINLAGLHGLAEEVLIEARHCEPLYFLEEEPDDVARYIACHGLTVARILARIVRQDADLKNHAHDVVVAGLIHDVGMLQVPVSILSNTDVLDPESRRIIEAHPHLGAEITRPLFPDAPWIAEGIAAHHERIDGTGYPEGLKGTQIHPLASLLAVADVYGAMCCTRPHRPARATRTALADTLLLADQGELDRDQAEHLLALSFYPVGSLVELAQGEIGMVVATPASRGDLQNPSRPVVALLTDREGTPLPRPHHLDLAEAEDHSIVRPLTSGERRQLLSTRFPAWAA
ncbi:MAG: HD domain-containing protein [Gemmataceae bacterium]